MLRIKFYSTGFLVRYYLNDNFMNTLNLFGLIVPCQSEFSRFQSEVSFRMTRTKITKLNTKIESSRVLKHEVPVFVLNLGDT